MIWGVDLGTRSVSLFGIADPNNPHDVSDHTRAVHIEVDKSTRGLELWSLAKRAAGEAFLHDYDYLFVEEPPFVNNRRTYGQLSMTAGAMLSVSPLAYPVAVDDWKKGTVGRGGVGKPEVARWLLTTHPELAACCLGNQNLMDAACIALYGRVLRGTSTRAD